MINTILRTIRDGVGTYMTHTTRWLVAAHYPFPMPNEDMTDKINDTPLPPCASSLMPSCTTPANDPHPVEQAIARTRL